ncbi:MAG: hypothetical protein ABWZ40_10260 [Caulobacterales bacterium]
MADQDVIQLLRTIAQLEAGGAPAINRHLAAECVARGYAVNWRDGYVRTRLGKAVLRRSNDA